MANPWPTGILQAIESQVPVVARRLLWLLLMAVVVAAPLRYLHLVNRNLPSSKSDLLPRWVGTRAALQGRDPYSPEVVREIQTVFYGAPLPAGSLATPQAFLYPAPAVLFLAPLALLSWGAAWRTFVVVTALLLVVSFWLCLHSLRLAVTTREALTIVLLAFCSWPVMWGLRMQQITLPVAALAFASWYLLRQGRQILPGILLAMAMVKPQLVVLLILWLFLWAAIRRRWAFIGSFAAALTLLWLATERVVPGWFSHWKASLHNYRGVTHTAPPLEHLLGHWAGLMLTLLIAAASGLALWRLRRCSDRSSEFGVAVSLALAVAVCLIPTNPALLYNYVVLLPGCLILIFSKPMGLIDSILRAIAMVQIVWDFLIVAAAASAGGSARVFPILAFLTFMDFLLPSLVTIFLVRAALGKIDRGGAARSLATAEVVPL